MVYIVLLSGLFLIYLALRNERKEKGTGVFSSLMPKKNNSSELENLRDEMNYLSQRIEDIERALIIIDEVLNQRDSSVKIDETKPLAVPAEEVFQVPQEVEKHFDEIEGTDTHENKNDNINSVIFELFDSGKTIEEISSVLRIGKGEVSLRLGLRKQRK